MATDLIDLATVRDRWRACYDAGRLADAYAARAAARTASAADDDAERSAQVAALVRIIEENTDG